MADSTAQDNSSQLTYIRERRSSISRMNQTPAQVEFITGSECHVMVFGCLGIIAAASLSQSLSHLRTFAVPFAILLLVGFLSKVFYKWRIEKSSSRFRFLDLPFELREHILEYAVDRDPAYPARPSASSSTGPFQRLFRSRKPKINGNPALLFGSKQLHDEYVAILSKRATFTLQINSQNYQQQSMWQISPQMFSNIRHVRLELHLTPSMMGTFDPRNASRSPSTKWPLYMSTLQSISQMPKLSSLDLYVHACGDPLWNPMWLWHWASQTFKQAEVKQLGSIRFKMDGPGLGENHLARRKGGCWEWRCRQGHSIHEDKEGWLPVRELCAELYRECAGCQLQKEMEEAEGMNAQH